MLLSSENTVNNQHWCERTAVVTYVKQAELEKIIVSSYYISESRLIRIGWLCPGEEDCGVGDDLPADVLQHPAHQVLHRGLLLRRLPQPRPDLCCRRWTEFIPRGPNGSFGSSHFHWLFMGISLCLCTAKKLQWLAYISGVICKKKNISVMLTINFWSIKTLHVQGKFYMLWKT